MTIMGQVKFDTGGAGEYNPDLYHYHALATGVPSFAEITDEHVALFHQQGYLVVEQAFTSDKVWLALDEILDVIDGKYPDFRDIQYEAEARARLRSRSGSAATTKTMLLSISL